MKKILLIALTGLLAFNVFAQTNVENYTRKDIMKLTYDELLEMPLEQVLKLAAIMGVSSDELFEMIMNKSVSSASKEEEDSFVSPLSTTVITREELRSYGVTTIEEAFRFIPGAIVSEKFNGIYDIQLRGLNNIPDNSWMLYAENANVLLLLDGRPIQNLGMGALNIEALPISIEDVLRIEVVRGAVSALYGMNAMTGVINIITEKPNDNSKLVSGSVQYGNLNTLVADLAFRKQLGKIAFGVTGNIQRRDRNTDQLRHIKNDGNTTFFINNENAVPDYGEYFGQNDLFAMILSGAVSIEPAKGGYISLEQLNRSRGINGNPIASVAGQILQYYMPMVEVTKAQLVSAGLSDEQIAEVIAENFGDLSVLQNAVDKPYFFSKNIIYHSSYNARYEKPGMARETQGANAYLTYTPTDKINFNFTGGWQSSCVAQTPINEIDIALQYRQFKTGYVNMLSNIYDLRLNIGYTAGPNSFSVGEMTYDEDYKSFNAEAEYSVKLNNLTIKPSVNYLYLNYKDAAGEFEGEQVNGFFNKEAIAKTLGLGLRFDYKLDSWRFIAGFRSDKTNIPDKWNPSWQLVSTYEINGSNFARISYGHSMRSPLCVNTSTNFTWDRIGQGTPDLIQFTYNDKAKLTSIDNIELGYRWKPTDKLLVDAEAYYSRSKNYNRLTPSLSRLTLKDETVNNLLMGQGVNMTTPVDLYNGLGLLKSEVVFKNQNSPIVANQFGIGLNADWIAAKNLIVKFNFNAQRTILNNYQDYDQNSLVMAQLAESYTAAMQAFQKIPKIKEEFMGEGAQDENLTIEVIDNILNDLGLEHIVDGENSRYFFGSSNINLGEKENGRVHEATPTLYGMIGAIYKPIEKLEISAFGNYTSKRSMNILGYNVKTPQKFTVNLKVGYKPINQCEVFVNAHNLFNTKRSEYAYTDEIGGLYTAGVTFNF
ncbi:MAG: TonB-dependent receptor [Salinivirgaceae bacterium]|nr:TonB-dependent receptor [Salinivirgaceae bacterium]